MPEFIRGKLYQIETGAMYGSGINAAPIWSLPGTPRRRPLGFVPNESLVIYLDKHHDDLRGTFCQIIYCDIVGWCGKRWLQKARFEDYG